KTVKLAVDHGVAIGAHPSLPDIMGFGRRVMRISPQEMYDLVVYQAGAVEAFARAAGSKLHHVKCHGALYNMAANDEGLSDAMVRAAKDLGAMLYVLSNSLNFQIARRAGVPVCAEVFADRGYTDEGTLAPRDKPGGMIEDAEKSVQQALAMIEEGYVTSLSGKRVPVAADTLCIHGDQPGAVPFAKALRQAFKERGIVVAAP
ncbi:MAG TPA: 5-oxoprolinase subunit PxpA, partial [Burkholderiales bacterium]|nr:5-oxoprolinase subunit PxpA [Burkholderiales bacterium]